MRLQPAFHAEPPALRRLARLAPLDDEAVALLQAALARPMTIPAKRDLLTEGASIREPLLMVSGWAARVRLLADGRRQFLSFLFPGDLIGLCRQPDPVAVSTVTALTAVATCPAPTGSRALDQAYAVSAALEEAYLLEHIARLGRLNAQERIASLLLEFAERLTLNGLAQGGAFEMPLTQEVLADALGLTSVHVNRMLQQARRTGDLEWQAGRVTLRDPATLAQRIGRRPARVGGGMPLHGTGHLPA